MEFLCPNGHRIQCGDEFAGKAANCPKCGIRFEVPPLPATPLPPTPPTPSLDADDRTAVDSDRTAVDSDRTAVDSDRTAADSDRTAVDISIGTSPTRKKPPSLDDTKVDAAQNAGKVHSANDEFEFVCPNGHRLQGPLALQGHPGQCPECEAKFRIPQANLPIGDKIESTPSISTRAESESLEPSEEKPTAAEAKIATDSITTADEVVDKQPEAVSFDLTTDSVSTATADSLYGVCRKYWDQRSDDARFELYLDDGERLTIESFDATGSSKELGIFGFTDKRGAQSVAIIPFGRIARIVVHDWKQ